MFVFGEQNCHTTNTPDPRLSSAWHVLRSTTVGTDALESDRFSSRLAISVAEQQHAERCETDLLEIVRTLHDRPDTSGYLIRSLIACPY
jgi:hypothetical protein